MKRTRSIETVVDNTGVVISSRGTSYGSGIIFDCSLPNAGTRVIVSWEEEVSVHVCKELQGSGNRFGLEDDGKQTFAWRWYPGHTPELLYISGFRYCPYCGEKLE